LISTKAKVNKDLQMGGKISLVAEEDLEAWLDLTHLSRKQILTALNIFLSLMEPHNKATIRSIQDHAAVIGHNNVVKLTQLRNNPFASRICQVFARDNEVMTFEEFLDMFSSLSKESPPGCRAQWAFKVFDYDNDGLLTGADIRKVVDAITGNDLAAFGEKLRENVVFQVLEETDYNRTGAISLPEFSQMVTKSIDFQNNFCIRL